MSIPNQAQLVLVVHLVIAMRGQALGQVPLNDGATGIVALCARHTLPFLIADFGQGDGSIYSPTATTNDPIAQEFNAAGVVEVTDMASYIPNIFAQDVGDLPSAELALVEDREYFKPAPVINRVGRRLSRTLRALPARLPPDLQCLLVQRCALQSDQSPTIRLGRAYCFSLG